MEKAQQHGEYVQECKEHGIKPLDYTEWEEKLERDAE
jgi:hypothetical protein